MIPTIAIDGPAAAGKGTVARLIADELGFHLLESGRLYRAVALAALQNEVAPDDGIALAKIAADLRGRNSRLNELMSSPKIADEKTAGIASAISAILSVRRELLPLQRQARRLPGLVAEGRDMATVVFPDSVLKIFLTASAEERARRRFFQSALKKSLRKKTDDAKMRALVAEIAERDRRDAGRKFAPLARAADAVELDTTAMSAAQAAAEICRQFWNR